MNDTPLKVQRETLDLIKERHLRFLEQRLSASEPRTRAEWRGNVASVIQDLMHAPIGLLVEEQALLAALDTAIDRVFLDQTIRPAIDRAAKLSYAALVKEKKPLGELVPKSAKDALLDIAKRPDLLPPKLVREIASHEAANEVMRDVLQDALKQFAERVNPFVAEWGLPSLLKKLGPFGLAGVGKSIDTMRIDFEKRLDPEIRKFLQGFSRDALKNTSDSIINRADTPAFVALRKRLVTFTLEQRLAELLLDEKAAEAVTQIGIEVGNHLLHDEELKAKRIALLREFVATNNHRPVREVLHSLGLPDKPPAALIDALADATFPALMAVLESPTTKGFLRSLVTEFYDGLPLEET